MKRTRVALSTVAVAVVAVVATVATACDTDDGRTMQTPATELTTTTPPPTTVAGGSAIPADQLPALVTAPPTATAMPGASGDGANGASGAGNGNGAASTQGDFYLALPFDDGTNIPFSFTCRGDGVAPAVQFWNAPPRVVEMALVVIDEDADGFVHWVVTGIDPMARVVSSNPDQRGVEALNDFGEEGWGPPCPPKGDGEHTYRFTMHGLNRKLNVAAGTPADKVIPQIEAASIASATVTGTYRQ